MTKITVLVLLGVGCTVQTQPASQTTPQPVTVAEAPDSAPTTAPPANTEQGIVCTGAETITLTDRHIVTDGHGLVVNGACTVSIVRSKIEAGGWGIVVNGSGDVSISESIISGAEGSISLKGAADVTTERSEFRGRVESVGASDIKDGGGNRWN